MDEELRRLINQASEHPQDSLERAKAIYQLIGIVQQLPGFYKSSHQDYFDALDQTWDWLGRNIENFQECPPSLTVSLVRWINGTQHWRIKTIRDERNGTISLDSPINEDGTSGTIEELISETGFEPPRLIGLDGYIEEIQKQHIASIAQKLKNYIDEDPNFILRNSHLKKTPQCNFQILLQRLHLKDKPDKKRTIAQEFGIPEQTLHAHYRRNWSKIQSHLQEIAQKIASTSELRQDHLL